MSGVVEFDVKEFRELYTFSLTDAQLEYCFSKAELRLNNTKNSIVCNLKERKILLYLLTAHLAELQDRVSKGNTSVGRVSSATQGSVSVSVDFPMGSDEQAWFAQTPFGAEYWTLTSKYRKFLYVQGGPSMVVRKYRH